MSLDDFWAYMPTHTYIYGPTCELWPGSSVNSRLAPIQDGIDDKGKPRSLSASAWLDRNKHVEQTTWQPGAPTIIRDQLIVEGGWIDRPDAAVFNQYRPPVVRIGDPTDISPWLDHLKTIYPEDREHMLEWLAHRVQRPGEKINHALVLGGPPGIGKDAILCPVRYAIGSWNFAEVNPSQLLGRFNSFIKSVILRINEARDPGDVNRYVLYEHSKILIAAPPEVLRCDEKNIREYPVPNVTGVIFTTNNKTTGLYLPADDRRHYVAWSEARGEDFAADHFNRLFNWYESNGNANVAAYLHSLEIGDFDAKAPPPKTQAFLEIADANRSPESARLADVIDDMTANNAGVPPPVMTLDMMTSFSSSDELNGWLRDAKNRRVVPLELEHIGYVRVRNENAKDGLWKINGRRQTVYGHGLLSLAQRIEAANRLTR